MATRTLTDAQRRVAFATLVGSAIEWYDFFIYGTAAALVFNKLFFPQFSSTAGTMLSFGTFAVGWLARPIGGIVAGHFGDRVGRKRMLIITLISMGIATTLIGVLPDYSVIGVWAPILLVVLRLLQGLSVGGEFGGGVVMAVEHAPEGRRGLFGSFPQMGVPLGLVLGTFAFYLISQLAPDDFISWGWRIPFLLSILLLIVGLYIRLKIEETPEFIKALENKETPKVPLFEALTKHPGSVAAVVFANSASNTYFYAYSTFFVSYLTAQLGYSRSDVLLGISLAAIAQLIAIPYMGNLSDRIGRKKVYIACALLLGLTAAPAFWLIGLKSVPAVILVQIVCLGLLHGSSSAAAPSLYSDLFPANVRYTGVSLGYQLSGVVFGGPLPAVATALIAAGSGQPWIFVGYLILTAIISAVAMVFAPVIPESSVEEPQVGSLGQVRRA